MTETMVPKTRSRFFAAATALALVFAGGFASPPPAQAAPRPTSCEVTGKILIQQADGSPARWISKTWNEFGEYVTTELESDALTVTTHVGSQQLMVAVDGPNPALPYVGGIVGFSSPSNDLRPGSANYTYLGGTGATAPGSPAVAGTNSYTNATRQDRDIQSAIWTLGGDLSLSPQWVNMDGTVAATSTLEAAGFIMVLSGDPAAFDAGFGGSQVSMTLVPRSTNCSDFSLSPQRSTVAAGASHTFTASIKDDDGVVLDATASTVYTSSNSSDTITGNVLTATAAGVRTITATHIGLVDTATVTVIPSVTTAINVSPQTATASADATTTFTVTAEDAYGNQTDVTALAAYTSSNSSDTFADNVLTAPTAGTRTITATHGGRTDTAKLTVTAGALRSIGLALSGTQVNQGDSITATVEGFDAAGNSLGDLTSAVTLSSDQATDIVNGNTVTFPHASVHVITATLGQLTSTVSITVIPTAVPTPTPTPLVIPTTTPAALGTTGVDPTGTVTIAVLLLLAGAGALIASRRLRTNR